MLAQQDFEAHNLRRKPEQHHLLSKTIYLALQPEHFSGANVVEGINRSSKSIVLCSSGFKGDISLLVNARSLNFRHSLREREAGTTCICVLGLSFGLLATWFWSKPNKSSVNPSCHSHPGFVTQVMKGTRIGCGCEKARPFLQKPKFFSAMC